MSNVTEVATTLALDLSRIPKEEVNDAKTDVAEYIVNEILRATSKGKSPVKGETFKTLTEAYADKEKGGSKRPNLRLEGDMMDDLGYTLLRDNLVKIGIEGSQAPKADGHNQISEEAKQWSSKTGREKYKRRFIPAEGQEFKANILSGIQGILDSYRTEPISEGVEIIDSPSTSGSFETVDAIGVDINNIFNDTNLELFLLDALQKRSKVNGF